jgi:hypothetical protein
MGMWRRVGPGSGVLLQTFTNVETAMKPVVYYKPG